MEETTKPLANPLPLHTRLLKSIPVEADVWLREIEKQTSAIPPVPQAFSQDLGHTMRTWYMVAKLLALNDHFAILELGRTGTFVAIRPLLWKFKATRRDSSLRSAIGSAVSKIVSRTFATEARPRRKVNSVRALREIAKSHGDGAAEAGLGLAAIGDPLAVSVLASELRRHIADHKTVEIVRELGRIGDARSLPSLIDAYRISASKQLPVEGLERAFSEALNKIPPKRLTAEGETVVTCALRSLLDHTSSPVRLGAVKLLGRTGSDEAVLGLIEAVFLDTFDPWRDGSTGITDAALTELNKLVPTLSAELRTAAKLAEVRRHNALDALTRITDPRLTQAMMTLIQFLLAKIPHRHYSAAISKWQYEKISDIVQVFIELIKHTLARLSDDMLKNVLSLPDTVYLSVHTDSDFIDPATGRIVLPPPDLELGESHHYDLRHYHETYSCNYQKLKRVATAELVRRGSGA